MFLFIQYEILNFNFLFYFRHNTHHYLEFFNAIRQSIKDDTFDKFREKINSKFPKEDS